MSLNKHFGKGIDPSGYDFNVFKALGDFFTLSALIFNQTVLGCAAAQVFLSITYSHPFTTCHQYAYDLDSFVHMYLLKVAHEYDAQEAKKDPLAAEVFKSDDDLGRQTENPMRLNPTKMASTKEKTSPKTPDFIKNQAEAIGDEDQLDSLPDYGF